MRSSNLSPYAKQNENREIDKNELNKADIGNLIKKLPKTVELQDNLLVEGCFSYVD